MEPREEVSVSIFWRSMGRKTSKGDWRGKADVDDDGKKDEGRDRLRGDSEESGEDISICKGSKRFKKAQEGFEVKKEKKKMLSEKKTHHEEFGARHIACWEITP